MRKMGMREGYLRTQGLQLHGGHAHQLHAFLVVGDGAGQVGDLRQRETQRMKTAEASRAHRTRDVKPETHTTPPGFLPPPPAALSL